MDAILLCMKEKGIRFFSKMQFPNIKVTKYYKKEEFLDLLKRRINEFDNVLIMAHGADQGILTTTKNPSHPYKIYISLDETNAFKNDFVFAVSCYTANEFGRKCVQNGALAYLGYQVEIGSLFCSYEKNTFIVPKRINKYVDTIIKHIFIEELSHVYEKFIQEPISVQVLKELFSYVLEKRISELLEMNLNQIKEKYGVTILEADYRKYFVKVVLEVLSLLDEVSNHLVCLGDSNYISATSFKLKKDKDGDIASSIKELECNTFFMAIESELYKNYLRGLFS